MQDKVINDVKKIVQENRRSIPRGYKLWEGRKPWEWESLEVLMVFLSDIFREEEKVIENKRKARLVTDDYENGVRSFALALTKALIASHETLKDIMSYVELLGQKHMAYAFYHLLEAGVIDAHDLLTRMRYRKSLYQGLIDFYSSFYGCFSDNEEAICLLCKYYPRGNGSWPERKEVITALIAHIKNAGTPSDLGYAYQGIEQIRRYIPELPNALIRELLKEYSLYEVLHQGIYRHQIFAIIDGSGLDEKEKHALKFFYLDSLLLADTFNNLWVDRAETLDVSVEKHYNAFDEKLNKKQIQVLKTPHAYWDNENTEKRLFWEDGKRAAGISLQKNTIIFRVWGKQQEFPFVYKDWQLTAFQRKGTKQKFRRLISEGNVTEPEGMRMTFSLLYLDHYRGMQGQTLDFDHRYAFCPDSGELMRNKAGRIPGFHFYGKSVYSLSCIVGKNGTGKTSTIHFLREVFYKIIRILEDFDVPCEEGCVGTGSLQEYKVLDEKADFLIVFRVGDDDYFLTNVAGINAAGALPYRKGVCHRIDFCKVAYFSQQMQAEQMLLYENGQRTERSDVSGISRILNGLGQCDYSEMRSYLRRRNVLTELRERKDALAKGGERVINRELCCQFSLLRNIKTEKIYEELDIPRERDLMLYHLETGDILEKISFSECQNTSRLRELEKKYAGMPYAGLGFFSSGQRAKFNFLARLNWFLAGCGKDIDHYETIFGRNFFPLEETLQKDETALIFIDEGELYYHPEWQRKYLSTLLYMLCFCEGEARLQVVFTTNSPFVISDVLRADVQYLSDQEETFDDTLGQNIHKLLKRNFFMDYTIGEYSRKLIESIIQWLDEENGDEEDESIFRYFDQPENENETYDKVGLLIHQIGESVYRNKLEKMLEERLKKQLEMDGILKESRIHELERKKVELEKEIAQLKGEKYDKN